MNAKMRVGPWKDWHETFDEPYAAGLSMWRIAKGCGAKIEVRFSYPCQLRAGHSQLDKMQHRNPVPRKRASRAAPSSTTATPPRQLPSGFEEGDLKAVAEGNPVLQRSLMLPDLLILFRRSFRKQKLRKDLATSESAVVVCPKRRCSVFGIQALMSGTGNFGPPPEVLRCLSLG